MRQNLGSVAAALSFVAAFSSSCSAEDPAFTQASDANLKSETLAEAVPGNEKSSDRNSGDSIFEPASSNSKDPVPDPKAIFNPSVLSAQSSKASEILETAGKQAGPVGTQAGATAETQSNVLLGNRTGISEMGAGGKADQGNGSSSTGPSSIASAQLNTGSNTPSETSSGAGATSSGTSKGAMLTEGVSTSPLSLQKRFEVKSVKDVSGNFYVEDNWASQPIQLQNLTEAQERTFTQVTRPRLSSSFKQGASGKAYIETLPQLEAAGVLDLVLVIDNSGSMSNEQENLSTKLSPLLSYISASDWKIGVVTTDPNDSCMRAVISKGDEGSSKSFENAINAGLAGNGNEVGIRQAVTGLNCPNSKWTRPSATTAVLIVSDEDNCSNGKGCGTEAWNNENYLLDYLKVGMGKTLGSDARVYGLFKHPTDNACTTAANVGNQYAAAVEKSGGTWGSICAKDYSSTLSKISQDVSTILKKQFALKTLPDPNTVVVTLILQDGNRVPATAYTVSGEVITFTTPPPAGSTIEVSYSTYAEPQLSQFNLGNKAVPGSAVVQVNGVTMASSSFSVSGQTLTFTKAPPAESEIQVNFTKDDPLLKTFNLGSGVEQESLNVRVGGTTMPQTSYTFDRASGLLSFVSPPNDGSIVFARFTKVLGPKLNYTIMTSGQAITEAKAQYADNVEVRIAASGTEVTLTQRDQVRVGQTLWVQYRLAGSTTSSYKLPSTPTPGTLNLKSSIEACEVGKQIVANADSISINCNFRGQLKVEFSFETYAEPQRAFVFSEIALPEAGNWAVSLDGSQLAEASFVRQGNKITLRPDVVLSQESIVTIAFSSKEN